MPQDAAFAAGSLRQAGPAAVPQEVDVEGVDLLRLKSRLQEEVGLLGARLGRYQPEALRDAMDVRVDGQ